MQPRGVASTFVSQQAGSQSSSFHLVSTIHWMFLFKHLLRGREIGVIMFWIRVGDIVINKYFSNNFGSPRI